MHTHTFIHTYIHTYIHTNPFHFLKRHCDLSQTLLTPCPCSRILKRKTVHRYLDIRAFISSESHNSSSSISSERHTTREDLVRGAHDRGKKARLLELFSISQTSYF